MNKKRFTHAYNLWYNHIRHIRHTNMFWPSVLDLEVLPVLFRNLSLGYIFWTRRGMAFKIHMYIPCDTIALKCRSTITIFPASASTWKMLGQILKSWNFNPFFKKAYCTLASNDCGISGLLSDLEGWPNFQKLIANWLEAKTIIFRYFLARYRNFLPQVDQKVHQVLQNFPQACCIGDVIRSDSIKSKKYYKI